MGLQQLTLNQNGNIQAQSSNCHHDSVEVPPYGVFTKELAQPNIQYTTCAGSVILAIIFCETVVAPVYLIGWELYEPVGKKK